ETSRCSCHTYQTTSSITPSKTKWNQNSVQGSRHKLTNILFRKKSRQSLKSIMKHYISYAKGSEVNDHINHNPHRKMKDEQPYGNLLKQGARRLDMSNRKKWQPHGEITNQTTEITTSSQQS